MALTTPLLARRLKKLGIVNPLWTIRAARAAKLPLPLACALLEQETGGGRNVYGHDRDRSGKVIWHGQSGTVPVTRENYRDYLAFRKRTGLMQGVGPLQLTWWSIQDEADERGGCWKPLPNMQVGFSHLATLIRRNGLRLGVRAYNGSGPQADAYADSVLAKTRKWEAALKAQPVTTAQTTRQPTTKKVVLNPRDWWKRWVYGDTDCDRRLLTALANVAQDYSRETGTTVRVFVRSGYRSNAEQAVLYRLYQQGRGPLAAKPGRSNHNRKNAADCQLEHTDGRQTNIGADQRARALMRKRGLCLPVPGETWHVEIGTRWSA